MSASARARPRADGGRRGQRRVVDGGRSGGGPTPVTDDTLAHGLGEGRQIVLVANIIDGKVVGLERKQPRRLIDRTRMSMSKGDWSLMLEGKHIL